MKSTKKISNVVRLFFLLLLLISPTAETFSQSGQTDKSDPQKTLPVHPISDEAENVSKLELYDFIEPTTIELFVKKLNEFGAKDYRVRDLTQIPYGEEEGNSSAWGTKLAGVVKLDETQYEYKILEVEELPDLTAALNRESIEGFNFREIITFQSSLGSSGGITGDDSISNSLRVLATSPQMHNLILLERETLKTSAPRQFQLLKAGFGIGKKPSEKMQMLVDESAKQNFYPVGAFMSYGFAAPDPNKSKWKIADNYYGVIVEKSVEKQNIELQFVRASLQGTFKKRVNELASNGFRMGDAGFLHGFMYKSEETPTPPAAYQWLNASSKTFSADLEKITNTSARLYGSGLHIGFVGGVLTESNLIFEQPIGADKVRYEYRSLKMSGDPPQTILIAKIIFPPDEPIKKFRRLVRQGYSFASLIYANGKVTALFERQHPE